MIDTLVVTNNDTEVSITIGRDPSYLYLIDNDGLDLGNSVGKHTSYDNIIGTGTQIVASSLQDRTITLKGTVWAGHTSKYYIEQYGVTSVSEITKLKLSDMNDAKETIAAVINPLSELTIGIGDFYIVGKPSASIQFGTSWKENNEVVTTFTFSIECPDPMFKLVNPVVTTVAGVIPQFHFPLILPKNVGVPMGRKVRYDVGAVKNKGSKSSGAVITLKALKTVSIPVLTNIYGDQTITINKTLAEGEYVRIDTTKRTVVGKTAAATSESNYISYWLAGSDWMEFQVGTSLVGISATSNKEFLDVYIEINEQYFAVRGQ